jgi:type III secretion protein S
MDEASIVTHMSQAFLVFMIWVLPPLVAAVAAGLGIGIFQAATQIQNDSLPLAVKLLVVVAVIGLFSRVLSAPLIEYTDQIFADFPAITSSY